MKKIFFVLALCALPFTSSFSQQNNDKPATTTTTEKSIVKQINAEEFRQLVWDYKENKEFTFKGKIPCIIDFYTVWCGPCRRVAPIMEELAKEYKGKINVYKVNTEDPKSVELAQIYQIYSIPTVAYFPKEGFPMKSMGALPKEQFKEIIDNFLLNNNKPDTDKKTK